MKMNNKTVALLGAITVVTAFLAGAVVSEFQLSPAYDFFSRAFSAASALKVQVVEYDKSKKTDLWNNTRHTGAGVTVWDKEKAYNGYTLFSSAHDQKAFLVDMEGKVAHEWAIPFREAWPTHPHIRKLVDPSRIVYRRCVLYPNGDLVVVFVGAGAAPWGYGLARIDKNSNVIWRINDYFHHDVTLGEDGNIYTLTHSISNEKIDGFPEMKQPYFRDYAVVVSPEGKVLKRIDILDSIVKRLKETGEEAKLYASIYRKNGDLLHTNTARYVPRAFAEKVPGVEVGQIMISSRSLSMLAVIDPETEEINWTLQGPWKRQHDPDMLPNGHLLIYDNIGRRVLGGKSSIIEYDPVQEKPVWVYTEQKHGFDSGIRGCEQKLPNGNVLITEGQGGRILEVTRAKELVWEWISPYRSAPDGELTAAVIGANRFSADELPFLKGE